MADALRVRYEVDLSAALPRLVNPASEIRPLSPRDREELARLMLDAYQGTIDYEGETLTEATEEIDSWFSGTPMLDHSFGAVLEGRLVSAILLMEVDGAPLVRSVMTAPGHKGRHFGRAATYAAFESLKQAGYRVAVLFITKGNSPSERLFASLGAQPRATDHHA